MSKAEAERGMPGNPELDRLARLNAGMLPPQPGVLECDRHSYPSPPQRLHKGNVPTGGAGGGHLHDQRPT